MIISQVAATLIQKRVSKLRKCTAQFRSLQCKGLDLVCAVASHLDVCGNLWPFQWMDAAVKPCLHDLLQRLLIILGYALLCINGFLQGQKKSDASSPSSGPVEKQCMG